MNSAAPHYRDFLEREFASRLRRNPGYSLRAFARDIGLPASRLSEVLRGQRNLSPETGARVAKGLKLSGAECETFLQLVGLHQKRSAWAKRQAEEQLKRASCAGEYGELSLERFKIISDWHHFAILELSEIEGFESSPAWIAGRLGIPTAKAKEAIERLLDFGLLERLPNGEIRQTKANLATPSGVPSREIREHHSQILMKAEEALQELPVEEREFSAITLAFHSEQMPEIRQELKKMRRRLGQKIQEQPGKDRVYCLAIQFFPVDRKENPSHFPGDKL